MTLAGFKRDIEVEFHRVIDITLKQGVAPSKAAMTAILRHELNRLVEIRAKWKDPHVLVDAEGNLVPSEEVSTFVNNLLDQLLRSE
jgi:hypothetical protein